MGWQRAVANLSAPEDGLTDCLHARTSCRTSYRRAVFRPCVNPPLLSDLSHRSRRCYSWPLALHPSPSGPASQQEPWRAQRHLRPRSLSPTCFRCVQTRTGTPYVGQPGRSGRAPSPGQSPRSGCQFFTTNVKGQSVTTLYTVSHPQGPRSRGSRSGGAAELLRAPGTFPCDGWLSRRVALSGQCSGLRIGRARLRQSPGRRRGGFAGVSRRWRCCRTWQRSTQSFRVRHRRSSRASGWCGPCSSSRTLKPAAPHQQLLVPHAAPDPSLPAHQPFPVPHGDHTRTSAVV